AEEQCAAVSSTKHAGEHAGAGLNVLVDLAAREHSDDPAAHGVGDPQCAVRVKAATVGGDDDLGEHLLELPVGRGLPERGPGAAIGESAVIGDVECGNAVRERLANQ